MDLLDTPIWNKGTAFDDDERATFGLHGLLPPSVESLEQQVGRAYEAFKAKETDLERHIYLRQLQDTNETLFYRLMLDHVEEMMPIVSAAWPHRFLSLARLDRRNLAQSSEPGSRRHRRYRW